MPMNRTKKTGMVAALLALAMSSGLALADDVRYRGSDAVVIDFDEPVVSAGVVENGYNTALAADKRGLDLFDVTGDPSCAPLVRWMDQDKLLITFTKGTSLNTKYRLAFRPGADKYLSGKKMPDNAFEFSPQAQPLKAVEMNAGIPGGAATVTVEERLFREQLNFSPTSAVRYEFREVVKEKPLKYGKVVAGKAEVLRIKHVTPRYVDNMLSKLKELGLKEGREGLEEFSQETIVPSSVLVTPQEPLDTAKLWELHVVADESTGFRSGRLERIMVEPELATAVKWGWYEEKGKSGYRGCVFFGAPVAKADLAGIFRSLDISIGDHVAVTSEDGKTKTLTHQGKTIIFRMKEPEPQLNGGHRAWNPYNDWDYATMLMYNAPYTNRIEFEMEGAEGLPLAPDVVIKAGTKSMLGLSTACDHRHRYTLNTSAPALTFDTPLSHPHLLPLNGEHVLRLESLNNAKLHVRVARMSAEQYVQHYMKFRKIDEHAEQSLARVTYELRLLEKRLAAGLESAAAQTENLKSLKREITRLKSRVPDYAALRTALEGVEFSEEQTLDASGTGEEAVRRAESVIDLNALCGGNAGAGYYLVSIRSEAAPAVRACLRELELPEDLLDYEMWSSVQLTDLNLVNNCGSGFMVHSLSNGSPCTEGKVLRIDEAEATPIAELKDGLAVLPRMKNSDRKKTQVLVQCGEDFRLLPWTEDYARLKTDRRILTVTDRPIYRPGDTVYLRGVLRSVSPMGEPSLPDVSSIELIVSRPDRKEMIRKNIKLNEFGAFDFSFKLPKGEEDIVGTYRVSIQADGNKYRDAHYVNCQEFRRDAFQTEVQLKADPVRPKEFTYTVRARDFNGVPLTGAKATLEFELEGNSYEHPAPGLTPVRPHIKDKTWEETLQLDANGTATYTGTFDYLHTDTLMSPTWNLRVTGYVANDREEVRRLKTQTVTLYPADFCAYLTNEGSGRLKLYDNTCPGEDDDKLLNRDQSVSLRLVCRNSKQTQLPNGVVIVEFEPMVIWEGECTVPANSVNGVEVGVYKRFAEYCEKVAQEQNERDIPTSAWVEIRGKDTAGREMLHQTPLHFWRTPTPDAEPHTSRVATCTVKERTVQLKATFEHAGKAAVVVTSVAGTRAAGIVEVQKGENTWDFPLTDAEYGDVNIAVLLPVEHDSRFFHLEYAGGDAEVERVQTKLTPQLNIPEQHPRPGATITLSGTLLGADGKPATGAQVTLFAVDKGMLSVGDGHTVPNPGTFFTSVWVQSIHPQFVQSPAPLKHTPGSTSASLMAGLWQGDIVGKGTELQYFNSHAPMVMNSAGTRAKAMRKARGSEAYECAEVVACDSADMCAAPEPVVSPCMGAGDEDYEMEDGEIPPWLCEESGDLGNGLGAGTPKSAPRLRTDFTPVAVWAPALPVDAEGKFSTQVKLPDTLTTYQVYAVALGADGKSFGYEENEFTVSQPVMLTPGTPLFMSVGDCLRLPLTITNNTDTDATWSVQLEGVGSAQQIALKAKSTATLYFDYTATEEGERKLHWVATADAGGDAVEGSFEVFFPAPVLREAHRLVLQEGAEPLKVASLPAPELAASTRGNVEIQLSANPLLHLNECMELFLSPAYSCTEQYATSLLPWMLYDRMAPFSPVMASTPADEARKIVTKGIARLVKCQRRDGGMGFWPESEFCLCSASSPWASAYAGLVLTIATDCGYAVPEETLSRLRDYLSKYIAEMRKDPAMWRAMSSHIIYACGRVLNDEDLVREGLNRALIREKLAEKVADDYAEPFHPRVCCMSWFCTTRATSSLLFLAEMHRNKEARHDSFLKWMRVVGHDYRHITGWDGGWMLIALHEYLRLTPAGNAQATVTLEDGRSLTLGNGVTALTPAKTPTLGEIPTILTRTEGTVYVAIKFRARPEQTEYPGVTEKGMQVTRIYECRDEKGAWVPVTEFKVGDVVRVTLTCAKADKDLEFFVLEDYLPSNLEAINPAIPSQAAGLEWAPWSNWFDNREFQAHRVRGFCSRWGGRELLNMSYFARVKRAGTATAPPASAQLMYEPQNYGLSPNTKVSSK